MRKQLDKQLLDMNNELILMGGICEDCIRSALEALKSHNRELAMKVSSQDYDIDKKARFIEKLCLDLLLRQQPVATDLRSVSAVLKMISDIERIGDQACDIAEIVMNFDFAYDGEDVTLVENMAEEVLKMVLECIDSYVVRDVDYARAVIRQDDVVDRYFSMIKKELISRVRSSRGSDAEISLDVLMMAKYLERIGDHSCNVAKWVIYAITGNNEKDCE